MSLLGLLALALSVRAFEFAFVNFDDPAYFYENPHVLGGLTPENLVWAFEIHGPSMWIPLTWLSHQTMVTFFGAEPGPQHLFNILLHCANVILLFAFLRALIGRASLSRVPATPTALLATLLFVVHPIHVESYAWVTERKDVLSLFFSLLALLAWCRWRQHGQWRYYLGSFIAFALAVMAKPLAVTLPCVLVMLDVWPNRVIRDKSSSSWLGYLPFFVFTAFASWMTVLCQHSIGAIGSLEEYPLSARLPNVLTAYGIYLRRLFWPTDLAAFYPYPASPSVLGAFLSAFVLGGLGLTFWKLRQKIPPAPWGFLFFLGTMVPMIGLVQAGAAHVADRYAYLPFIGLYLALATTWIYSTERRKRLRWIVAGLFIAFLFVLQWRQMGYWRNSEALFTRATAVVEGSWLAENNLGLAYKDQGRFREARFRYERSLEAKPDYVQAMNNLAILEAETGNFQSARSLLEQSLLIRPDHSVTHHNLGKVLLSMGDSPAAEAAFDRALELAPDYVMARYDLSWLLLQEERFGEAEAALRRCLELNAGFANAWVNLGVALERQGRPDEALESYHEGIRVAPSTRLATTNFVRLAEQLGRFNESIPILKAALHRDPADPEWTAYLSRALAASSERR